jgi:hypothetical protein
MKKLIALLLSFNLLQSNAQTTNIKTGLWGDNTVWNTNSIPGSNDVIVLNFDVIVNVNAACKSLNPERPQCDGKPSIILNIVGPNGNGKHRYICLFLQKRRYITIVRAVRLIPQSMSLEIIQSTASKVILLKKYLVNPHHVRQHSSITISNNSVK